jgi:UDP-glucose 4-epimerase
MTILLTGGAGYIGSHTTYELLNANEKVCVLDNLSTGAARAVPKQAIFVSGDVGDQQLVRSVIRDLRIESIIHFAGSIVVPDSVRDPLPYYYNNTVHSRSLIEAAIECGVKRFIFSSTAAVYGEPQQVPVSEDAPIQPLSPYGWSKLMTEVMLRDASQAYGLEHIILRYFNVAGADPLLRTGQLTPNSTHLIKVAVQTSLGIRDHLAVYGTDYPTPDGTCIRDYIHVTDLAHAHRAALDGLRAGKVNLTLNCGYGRGSSVQEVIEAVERVSGRSLPVRHAGRRPGDPAKIVADVRRIQDQLGWAPKFADLDLIVHHAMTWEKALQSGTGVLLDSDKA